MRRTIWQGCQITPLFHADDQDDQINQLIILAGGGLGFFWLRRQGRPRGSFVSIPNPRGGRPRGWFPKFKCAKSAISAISPLLVYRLADLTDQGRFCSKILNGGSRQAERCLAYAEHRRPFPSSTWSVRWTNATILLPTPYVLANVPSIRRHAGHLTSGRWCDVFQVVKTAQSRGRTERTLFKGLTVVRFLGRVQSEGRKLSLVTMVALCLLHHRARR